MPAVHNAITASPEALVRVIVRAMHMRVRVNLARAMSVAVDMHEMGALQQIPIAKNGTGRAVTGNVTVFQHDTAVCNVFDYGKVVGCSDDGFLSHAPKQKIDHMALAFRVECRSGFVHEQDVWIENQN